MNLHKQVCIYQLARMQQHLVCLRAYTLRKIFEAVTKATLNLSLQIHESLTMEKRSKDQKVGTSSSDQGQANLNKRRHGQKSIRQSKLTLRRDGGLHEISSYIYLNHPKLLSKMSYDNPS